MFGRKAVIQVSLKGECLFRGEVEALFCKTCLGLWGEFVEVWRLLGGLLLLAQGFTANEVGLTSGHPPQKPERWEDLRGTLVPNPPRPFAKTKIFDRRGDRAFSTNA